VATIVGTAGDDRLKGTRAADVIVGGKGVDEIYRLGGDDLICGGFGYEVIPNDEGRGRRRGPDLRRAG
jgi:Ca2+-binding RTX toxin-like protein